MGQIHPLVVTSRPRSAANNLNKTNSLRTCSKTLIHFVVPHSEKQKLVINLRGVGIKMAVLPIFPQHAWWMDLTYQWVATKFGIPLWCCRASLDLIVERFPQRLDRRPTIYNFEGLGTNDEWGHKLKYCFYFDPFSFNGCPTYSTMDCTVNHTSQKTDLYLFICLCFLRTLQVFVATFPL